MNTLSVLLPPGMGDIYWVMCIIEDLLKVEGADALDASISSAPGGKDRSIDYVKMISFIHTVDYYKWDSARSRIWQETCTSGGRGVFRGIEGFDYLICLNGHLEGGKRIEDTGYKVNYYPPLVLDQAGLDFGKDIKRQIGPYVVAFVADHSFYQRWLRGLPPDQLYAIFKGIREKIGCRVILTGASWDHSILNNYLLALNEGNGPLVNLIGKTSMSQLFGLFKASEGCIGHAAGNTIMSVVLRKPTVIIWNKYFGKKFWRNTCPPDSYGKWYLAADSDEHSSEDVINMFLQCRGNIQ